MNFVFSKHAEQQMLRRNISRENIISTILQPEQTDVDSENPEITIFQSLVKEYEQVFLLRIFINTYRNPNVIVTLYKTTKIKKYYESKI